MLSVNEFTVVICAYTEKRWDDLVSAVRSIQAQTKLPKELIIVIDHNTPLAERAMAMFDNVTIIENMEIRGLSGARNTAIKVASGNVIAFMDEDASAESDWLERLAEGYADDDVIAVGGAIIPEWLTTKPPWFPDEYLWVVGCTYFGMPVKATTVRNLIGCNMSFRTSVFHCVGGFRNDIGRVGARPIGCEETELCIRASQQRPASKLIYNPTAIVHHRVPGIRSNWAYFSSRCYSEGISKALVSRYVGSMESLASERTYAIKALPSGVIRGLKDMITGQDPGGLGKAAAIVIGLLTTVIGYVFATAILAINSITKPTSRIANNPVKDKPSLIE